MLHIVLVTTNIQKKELSKKKGKKNSPSFRKIRKNIKEVEMYEICGFIFNEKFWYITKDETFSWEWNRVITGS